MNHLNLAESACPSDSVEELSLAEDGEYREELEEQASIERAREIEDYRKQIKQWQNEAANGEYTSSSDDDGSDILRWGTGAGPEDEWPGEIQNPNPNPVTLTLTLTQNPIPNPPTRRSDLKD